MISITDGLASIPTAKGEIIIEELPMVEYEKFYRHWLLAAKISEENPGSTFTTLFTANEGFRANMWEAMKVLGIEDPGMLSPKTMKALLVSHNGGYGVAFQLHEETPAEVKPGKPIPVPSRKNTGFLRSLRSSISGAISQVAFSVNQALFGSGLYALC